MSRSESESTQVIEEETRRLSGIQQLVWQGHPCLLSGTVDMCKKFHPFVFKEIFISRSSHAS